MKKVFVAILMILCGFAFIGSGVVLLSGCSTSQSETGGGGTSSPSEDETTENPNDQESNENEDVNDGTDVGDEDDDNIYAQDSVNFSVQISAFVPFSNEPIDYGTLIEIIGMQEDFQYIGMKVMANLGMAMQKIGEILQQR